ncbi:MAG TPA: M20/M25/M40 family metallo-hydrolase [Gemmatimonadales bacterium]
MRWIPILLIATACANGPARAPVPVPVTPERVRGLLTTLAADDMEGRMTGSRGAAKAAGFIAGQMQAAGLVPAGDSGYLQRLPLVRGPNGRPALVASFAARDTFPAGSRLDGGNVIGMLPGSDPMLRGETVVVSAHYDHVGIRQAVAGDSIYNGADDNASGVVTILEMARLLREGAAPKRTIVFVAFTGEELGGLGTRWYLQHPAKPLEETVANFNVEMTGRPDSLAGGPGKAWLTGYERSNMGEQLAANGIPIVADPRPSQNFFQRSDNYPFALRGIVAHTLSTFNLHADYHRPGDSADKADAAHMAQVIEAATKAVRILADGPKPEWKPGGKPERR